MPKKVLIVYATGGMGHVTAAKAIEKAFRFKYPKVEIKKVDVIDFAATLYKKVFVDGYNYVSARYPKIWGTLYHNFNKPSKQKLPSLLSRWAISGRFIPFIKEFGPDFIISTHPLPMMLVSASKRRDVIDIYSSMVVTDFGCHSFWVDPEVNFYFVAADRVGACLQSYGVKPGQIVATGIPIELKFSQELNKAETVKKLALNPGLKTLLIVGGQFSFESLKKIISGVEDKNSGQVQFLVVAGRDNALKEALNSSDLNKKSRVKVFGFIDNMEELMTVADLMFSKAGGLTVSESLAKGTPLVINKVIPGQEEDNVAYLTGKGSAIKVSDVNGIIAAVNDLISNPEKLAKMQKIAKEIGRPNSALDLADFVYSKIK